MRSLLMLFRYRALDFRRVVLKAGWAQLAVVMVFLVIGVGVVLGLFRFFSLAFPYLLSEPYSGPAVVRYIIELALASVFILGVASFVISSSTFLFRNRKPATLFAFPIESQAIFWFRYSALSAVASWPIILVAAPALVALGASLEASWVYFVSMIPVLLLFSLLISAVGGVLSFVFAFAMRRIPLMLVYAAEAVLFLFLAAAGARQVISSEVFTVLGAITPQAAEAAELRLQQLFSGLPSHPFAAAFLSVFPGQLGGMSGLVWVIVAITACLILLMITARRYYLPLWQSYGEGSFLARAEDVIEDRPRTLGKFPRIFQWGHGYLYEKDILTLLRSPGEVSRALFMLVLLALYVFAIFAISQMRAFEVSTMLPTVIAFMFAALSYFTLTLGMRFAFPALSLEGRGAWVLWASPLHAHEVLSWKYFFWSSLVLVIMEAATLVVSFLFGLPWLMIIFLLYATACVVLTLIAITLGQGTISPKFRDADPDMMSTSPSGLLATGIGVAYVYVVARYVHVFTKTALTTGEFDAIAFAGIFIVSVVLFMGYMFMARRKVESLELSR